ncbi:MAG: hypothetical protein COA44_06130 [Arcobacter sp.]|nr:MAG: hypothetical protein COA44_06130 [Arcobacter sp.]
MGKKIDWIFIKSEYEETPKSVRLIASENGISHTYINKKSKAENWKKFESDSTIDTAAIYKKYKIGKVAIRKVQEVVEMLGNNYSPLFEPTILMFANNYELYLDMKTQLDKVGVLRTTSKGTRIMSEEYKALAYIEKRLSELGIELGFTTAAAKKLGLVKSEDKTQSTVFDLNDKVVKCAIDV